LMAIIREGVAEYGLASLKTISGNVIDPGVSAAPAPGTPRLVYPAR
jgi:hypothetical protein